MNLFNWLGTTEKKQKIKDNVAPAASPVMPDDPSVQVMSGFGMFHTGYNFGTSTSQNIEKSVLYRREMANQPEVEFAIDEVVNEMVDFSLENPFEINFTEESQLSDTVKDKITESFKTVSSLYSANLGDDIRSWYIDGIRAWFIQLSKDRKNIIALKPIEPWMIKKVTPTRIELVDGVNTYIEDEPYYAYSQDGNLEGSKIVKLVYDSVLYIDSGKYDSNNNAVSYLDAAIKPLNDLLSLENATIIYRLTRAPEKRAFYVDTGQLPTNKAEEYVNALMKRFKTKLDYDSKTGVVKTSNQNTISATVDYWLPRREGSTGTEINQISETSNAISNISDDINYFKRKAFRALKIPESRVGDNPTFNLGQSGTITREEVKFSQFIDRLHNIYVSPLFQLIKVDLMIKGIMSSQEFDDIADNIKIRLINNDYFAETKRIELLTEKIAVIDAISPHVGKYFTSEFVFKDILGLSDEKIEQIKANIDKEPKVQEE
jgi:hypothetical protein